MDSKNRHMFQFAVFSVVSLISLLIGLVVYYNSLLVNLKETTLRTQDEVLQQDQYNFSKALRSEQQTLKGFAETFSMIPEGEESLLQMLDAIQRNTDFEYVTFAKPDGTAINHDGTVYNVSDRDSFHRAMSGETLISEPMLSKVNDAYIIAAATPVIKEEKIIGVLLGSFETQKLCEWFVNSFDGYGYTYIATNSGELIVKNESEYALAKTGNIFDLLTEAAFQGSDSLRTIRQNLVDGLGGHAHYHYQNQQRLMYYGKLDINDWNIFVIVNPQGIETTAGQILRNAIFLTGVMMLIFIVMLLYNVYSQRRFTHELTRMAYVDEVTGCHSFSKFRSDAEALLRAHVRENYMLIKMDIDKFKLINEMYGMETGNKVLRAVAKALKLALDEKLDTFGRIHTDEFILLISYSKDEEPNLKWLLFENTLAQSVRELVDLPLVLPQGRYRLEAGEYNLEEAYEKVNFAHRTAKNGDCRNVFYDGLVKERAIRERKLESRMEDAMQNDEFQLFLQPKYRLSDEKMVGAEALVRWSADSDSIVYPNEFIPLFEKNGFVIQLDMYMFEKSCKMLSAWSEGGITPIVISVNFSRRHLSNPDFVRELCKIADRYRVPHTLLEIELTETAMLENLEVLSGVLDALHGAGFTLSMDDFGTGHSSLGLLKDIAVDVIKIDKQFFGCAKDLNRAGIVIKSVMDMAQRLKIHTVAEGVETQEHIDLLRELGCETVQGYYFARPMPALELEVMMVRKFFTME